MRNMRFALTLAAATLFSGVAAHAQSSDNYAVDAAGYARVTDAVQKQLGTVMNPVPAGKTTVDGTAVKGGVVFGYVFDGSTLTVTLTCPTAGPPTTACQATGGIYDAIHSKLQSVIKSAL